MWHARGYDTPVIDFLSNPPVGSVWKGVQGTWTEGPLDLLLFYLQVLGLCSSVCDPEAIWNMLNIDFQAHIQVQA